MLVGVGGRAPRPWWRGARGIVAGVVVLVAAFVVTVALTRGGGKGGGGGTPSTGGTTLAAAQVALQTVADTGPDPFTGSVAARSAGATVAASPSATGTVDGADVGLYGGSTRTASCDVPKLSGFLTTDDAKGRAWAGVEGIDQAGIADYLRTLTPVVLRVDTRVTNHGFSGSAATPFQSVLQAGTAVLVDTRGLPRVRCACGNPLLPPAALPTAVSYSGTPWKDFDERQVVVVSPAASPVKRIVVVDPTSGQSFSASVGASGSAAPSGPSSASPGTGSSGSAKVSGSPSAGAHTGAGVGSGAPSGAGSAGGSASGSAEASPKSSG